MSKTVDIAIHFKCGECGNEGSYDPLRPYAAGGFFLSAHIEGSCETCESATWVLECGKCHGEMWP